MILRHRPIKAKKKKEALIADILLVKHAALVL